LFDILRFWYSNANSLKFVLQETANRRELDGMYETNEANRVTVQYAVNRRYRIMIYEVNCHSMSTNQ